jgi:hypothetical protein
MRVIKATVLVVFSMALGLSGYAQESSNRTSRLVFMEIRKGLTDDVAEVYEPMGIRLGVLLPEAEKVTGLGINSTITHFTDDQGSDLLANHKQSIKRYRDEQSLKANGDIHRSDKVINFQRVDYMPEGVGVLLHFWALPTPGSTQLQLKGDLVYSVISSDSIYSEQISGYAGNFPHVTETEWGGNVIKFYQRTYGKGEDAYISLRGELQNETLEVSLGAVYLLDADGNELEQLKFYHNNNTSWETRNKFDLEQVSALRFEYKKLHKKRVKIDRTFDLGL